jgi:nucleosome binding factor SPN SPT16 subunit
VKDDDTQPKTCLFHLWLLAFEFSETIIGISRSNFVILTSGRKKQILEKMEVPENYKGPKIQIILRDPNSKEALKAQANYQQFYQALFKGSK